MKSFDLLRSRLTISRHALYGMLIAVLVLLRLMHFGPYIDEPHDWRQCDTAFYIWDFYTNGIDLLHPSVCWMGGQDTVIFEFPLTEAVIAVAYNIFGESIPLARTICLLIFLAGLYFFYRIVELILNRQVALISTLVYLSLPLSIFYSRAIHIDFTAILFCHLMLYGFIKGIDNKSWLWLLGSGLAAGIAFVIKVPYAIVLVLPMGYYCLRKNSFAWILKYAWLALLPLSIYAIWQYHVFRINDAMPSWDFILHYRKMTPNTGWYFGTIQQRLHHYPWWILFQRGVLEVAGPGAILLFLYGVWKCWNKKVNLMIYWSVGVILYVLLFFNLNVIHNYYQIPLLAPMAIIVALGINHIYEQNQKLARVLVALLISGNFVYSEMAYYDVNHDHIQIGEIIQQSTPEDALVIVTSDLMDCRNPKILYRARRRGWSIETAAVNPETISILSQREGARHWFYVDPPYPDMSKQLGLDHIKLLDSFILDTSGAIIHQYDLNN